MFTRLKQNHRLVVLVALGAILLLCLLIAAGLGVVSISPLNIMKITLNKMALFSFVPTWQAGDETILFQIRLPRVIAGGLVGGGASVGGGTLSGPAQKSHGGPIYYWYLGWSSLWRYHRHDAPHNRYLP